MSRFRTLASIVAFNAGRVVERLPKMKAVAEVLYRTAYRLTPTWAAVLFRLGRLRERAKDWPGAEQMYTAGLAHDPRNADTFLGRRAGVRGKQGRWQDAIADFKAHPGMIIPRRMVPKFTEEMRHGGMLTEAIRTLEEAAETRGTAKIWVALAQSYAEGADLAKACWAFREALAIQPGHLTIRTNLGRAAALRSLVPFNLATGELTTVSSNDREEALKEAIEQLEHVVNASDTRTWAAYWLALLLEAHQMLNEAKRAYDVAIERALAVDSPWAHHAATAWQFRRTYVEHRISGHPSDDGRVNRTLTPGPLHDDLASVVGFFDATITNNGLLIKGFTLDGKGESVFTLDGKGESVAVCLDGQPIMRVAGNAKAWNREFKATIVHNVIGEFPEKAELTVRTGHGGLVTVGRSRSALIAVPDGRGALADLLESGRTITKKGRWSDVTDPDLPRDATYFAAYAKAKLFFEDELGIKLFVSYGTLLGCYRDGRLIPGDDDFDVSFVSDAASPEEFKDDGQRVIRALLDGGFDSRVAVDGRMLHLRVDDVVLDVNPFWFYRHKAWSFEAHMLSRDVFEPVSSTIVEGFEVYIPGGAEKFLEENYGSDWRIPRSDFQYHRNKLHQPTLRRARLRPSEVQGLLEYSSKLQDSDPSAGRFYGYADVTNPQFGKET